ncbi:MAG: GNAT family N-acetyltransferase [Rhodovulum sulfidophilum]|uniref:GNAT family N-acetyltransferase n=1 Tax=Rhodovulum sulfidophilum TaxID=35806 RepID=A0A2W5NF78_RHOSU|nr:MAG: GNAT family N-acetyltransferase [Rhodovulum sulfidophilum]
MFRIYKETPNDFAEVEYLYDLAFAPGRTALSSYRLRAGVDPVADLCLIARDDFDAVSGAIRYWPCRIGAAGHAALLLGPVAVHPTRQGEGLGAILMNESLRRAFDLGWTRIVLMGDEPYYSRFGFRRDLAREIDYPPPYNPDRLLARALVPGAFRGVSGMVRNWNDRLAQAASG